MRWSIDASLSFIQFSLRAHTLVLFSLRQVYLSTRSKEKKKKIIDHRRFFSSLFKLLFRIFITKISKYIYISKIGIRRSFFKKTMGDLFATWKRTRFLKESKSEAARLRLLFFNVLSFILAPPIQTKFPATRSPFHLVYLIIRVQYMFNKFTQRSFNLISRHLFFSPRQQFLQIKGKILSLSLSLLFLFFSPPPRRGKINRKMLRTRLLDETRARGEKEGERRRQREREKRKIRELLISE